MGTSQRHMEQLGLIRMVNLHEGAAAETGIARPKVAHVSPIGI